MICFDDFSFVYDGGRFGVHNINLTVQKGELIVLTGESGCGKTTLTRCINGLIPDFFEGEIQGGCRVCGMDIRAHETGDYSAHVGSVFQDPRSQFFTLHVKTEIPFPSENLGVPTEVIQERYRKTVRELNIANLLGKSIFDLSSGEKQKTAIASVYTANVQIYVLDEPSANLDSSGTAQLRTLLRQLKEQGCTVIISEHKLHYLKDLADRVILLRKGRIERILTGEAFSKQTSAWFRAQGLRRVNLSHVRDAASSVPAQVQTGPAVLFAENLSFGYPKNKPLWENASFDCRPGEIVGIVGKNGTGKSTLIRVLMGLERLKTGKISMDGRYASPKHRRRKSFYVMQDVDYQFFSGTVLEEMVAGHENETDVYEKAKRILDKFVLSDYARVHPSALSGGAEAKALHCPVLHERQSVFIF